MCQNTTVDGENNRNVSVRAPRLNPHSGFIPILSHLQLAAALFAIGIPIAIPAFQFSHNVPEFTRKRHVGCEAVSQSETEAKRSPEGRGPLPAPNQRAPRSGKGSAPTIRDDCSPMPAPVVTNVRRLSPGVSAPELAEFVMHPCLCLSSATARPANRLQAFSPAMNTGRGAFAYSSRRTDARPGREAH